MDQGLFALCLREELLDQSRVASRDSEMKRISTCIILFVHISTVGEKNVHDLDVSSWDETHVLCLSLTS